MEGGLAPLAVHTLWVVISVKELDVPLARYIGVPQQHLAQLVAVVFVW